MYERFWASETEIDAASAGTLSRGAGGGVEEIVDRLVGCAYGLGDVSAKSDDQMPRREPKGAEALFGGKCLIAQLQACCASPHLQAP